MDLLGLYIESIKWAIINYDSMDINMMLMYKILDVVLIVRGGLKSAFFEKIPYTPLKKLIMSKKLGLFK